jgi:hypothetical protein
MLLNQSDANCSEAGDAIRYNPSPALTGKPA